MSIHDLVQCDRNSLNNFCCRVIVLIKTNPGPKLILYYLVALLTLFSMTMVAADDNTEPPASNASWLRPRAWTPPDAAAAASGLVNCGTHQQELRSSWSQWLQWVIWPVFGWRLVARCLDDARTSLNDAFSSVISFAWHQSRRQGIWDQSSLALCHMQG